MDDEVKDWLYDEFSHVGVDYSAENPANSYDDEMETFRNYDEEAEAFLTKLELSNSAELSVIDLGCGTGAFSIHAAKYFKHIDAVDVSSQMIKLASTKAKLKNIDNITFHNSGLLKFRTSNLADIINTKWAFHHLPDYWKQVGLLNMNRMLKEGGLLLLTDVVFKFDSSHEENMGRLINDLNNDFSQQFVDEVKIHIKDEYSTFDWVLEGLIERAGFSIEWQDKENWLETEYLCKKRESL